MQITSSHQALQDFVWAVSYGKFDDINVAAADGQSQALDHLMQLMQYCARAGINTPEEVHIFSEFFAIPYVEKFFTDLFVSLHESLSLKAEAVFLRGLTFIIEYIGLPKSRKVVYMLLEKLQERFPALREMYDKAIANFIEEFFRPTIGDFIKQHKNAVDYLEVAYPLLYTLFVTPLKAPQFIDRRLYNFYCNPWIYQSIVNYLAYHARLSSPEISRERLERPVEWFEERLQIIRSRTSDESWQELTQKTHELCNHSNNLEAFATQSSGLLGEIRTAAQFLKKQCHLKDVLVFLPEKQNDGKNCDLMIIRHQTGDRELIECKTKSPRHGLDAKTAGDAQIWDDFFDNFTNAISSYLYYFQDTVQPILGLKLTKCFPLFYAFEGSNYGVALPLISAIINHPTTANIQLSKWSSEQKLTHLLRALFLRPLVLNLACVPLDPDDVRLTQRHQATKEALQKDWVNSLLNIATEQLKETYQRQKGEEHQISKMHVAVDLALSYRLLQDPLSDHDGNIEEIAAQTLHKAFQPFKDAFSVQSTDLDLLIVKP